MIQTIEFTDKERCELHYIAGLIEAMTYIDLPDKHFDLLIKIQEMYDLHVLRKMIIENDNKNSLEKDEICSTCGSRCKTISFIQYINPGRIFCSPECLEKYNLKKGEVKA